MVVLHSVSTSDFTVTDSNRFCMFDYTGLYLKKQYIADGGPETTMAVLPG